MSDGSRPHGTEQASSRRELRDRERATARARSSHRLDTLGSRLLSVAAMIFAGALAIGTSMPANAFSAPPTDSPAAQPADGSVQTVTAAETDTGAVDRDGWLVTSWAELLKLRYGTHDYSYAPTGTGPIRWPFPFAVPISSGFGPRVAPCRGCSTFHEGVDFTPGNGAPISAIADGVVIQHEDGGGEYGNFVIIAHRIDGHTVTSTYAHMQHGSSPLAVGQQVEVGDFVGLVGQTGQATGPHLHLEIAIDGVKVDPFSWLKANAG